MGEVLKTYQFEACEKLNLMKPIIFCNPSEELEAQAVSVSIPLAKEFQKQGSAMMRTMRLENNLLEVIGKLGEDPVIKDIDVLFNPAYQTDVLKSLINVCRKKQFRLIWPGRFEDGRLYYAEEGYRDYKTYDIANYDVTIIV